MAGSLHYQGLAKDLILYKDSEYLTMTEDYKFAGEKWKSMHELCRWGGDFRKPGPDGNHFSVTYEGKS
jgi:CDGSH-type Zn-finger protein